MDLFDVIRRDSRVAELADLLLHEKTPAFGEGLWGASAPILAAVVAQRLSRPLLLVCPHADEADDFREDIETALGFAPDLLPQLEAGPNDTGDDELAGERMRVCVAMMRAASSPQQAMTGGGGSRPELRESAAERPIIVAPIYALMQPVPSPAQIADQSTRLEVGQPVSPDALAQWLEQHGFQACEAVEVSGDFARRGGIVDVYSNAHTDPLRIEFFGDQVDSIRTFSPATQRSLQSLDAVAIPARRLTGSPQRGSATTGFFAHLPADTIIALHEPGEIQEIGRSYWQRLGEPAEIVPIEAILRRSADFSQLFLQRFVSGDRRAVHFRVHALPPFEANPAEALVALDDLAGEHEVTVLCDNSAEEQRFRALLAGEGDVARALGKEAAQAAGDHFVANSAPIAARLSAPAGSAQPPTEARERKSHKRKTPGAEEEAPSQRAASFRLSPGRRVDTAIGTLHRGFIWGPRAFVPHHELFHRYRQRRTLRRVQPARPIDSFFDLNTGDYVVHVNHGIGRFHGLKTLERDDRTDEYLAIEFADSAVVHVPISQIDVVQKYIGSFRGKPILSKVGGSAWKRTKQRVAEAVTDLAAELLAIQAQRATQAGVAYPADTAWQREFDGAFLYTETPDQLRAVEEIKVDMARPRPMDRLLCGDVGYGKTELAMRAAFKAMEYGKQVAVLVPTTVLAEQHFQTFRERMADYPFAIEVLSRFRTKGEQARIVAAARKGQVDLLIGTHRLLSKDVRFADLGLVIIDEEQRFGVEAKERLKQLRATVDVLTLSATPIPRTLHMAMLGIRDISSLATAPVDRRAIVTQVRSWEDALIREALIRELNRDGQAYFVHNFVRDIEQVANRLRTLVPEARFVIGHGQMSGPELEEVMLAFMRREADVLVSTNIIESGIDIPSANTIFINRADRFGLADLHQLRGRVGRSKHRAYAYLLLSPDNPVKEQAARRLKAIEQYSALGAGFQIAMRDLEIRGAGNILGPEQSGHIEAVGYEMYCQLMEQATRRLRNEPEETFRPVNLDLGISASIPRAYIRADRQRMEVYRRLTSCRSLEELHILHEDLRDAFGPLPPVVQTLIDLAEIRALAQPWEIRSIVLDPPDVIFTVRDMQKVQPLFSHGPGSPRVPDPQTVHWRLPKRLVAPALLVKTMREQLRSATPAGAAQLHETVTESG